MDKAIKRGSKKNYSGKEDICEMNHQENNRDEISLSNELNTTATFQESSPFQSCTESWQLRLEKLLAFLPWAIPLPTALCQSNQSSQSPFKNIINILSGVDCAHYLQMAASCLVSSHAGFGIICQTMLLVPFFLN